MSLITMPTSIRNIQWSFDNPSWSVRSPWTGANVSITRGNGAKWRATITPPTIQGDENIRAWRAFFASASDKSNYFRVYSTEATQTAQSNPIVDGAGQTGKTLSLKTMTPSTTVLTAGSIITTSYTSGAVQMHVLTQDLVADGAGLGVAYLASNQRFSMANNDFILANSPYCYMKMSTDTMGWLVGPAQTYDVSFECEEYIF